MPAGNMIPEVQINTTGNKYAELRKAALSRSLKTSEEKLAAEAAFLKMDRAGHLTTGEFLEQAMKDAVSGVQGEPTPAKIAEALRYKAQDPATRQQAEKSWKEKGGDIAGDISKEEAAGYVEARLRLQAEKMQPQEGGRQTTAEVRDEYWPKFEKITGVDFSKKDDLGAGWEEVDPNDPKAKASSEPRPAPVIPARTESDQVGVGEAFAAGAALGSAAKSARRDAESSQGSNETEAATTPAASAERPASPEPSAGQQTWEQAQTVLDAYATKKATGQRTTAIDETNADHSITQRNEMVGIAKRDGVLNNSMKDGVATAADSVVSLWPSMEGSGAAAQNDPREVFNNAIEREARAQHEPEGRLKGIRGEWYEGIMRRLDERIAEEMMVLRSAYGMPESPALATELKEVKERIKVLNWGDLSQATRNRITKLAKICVDWQQKYGPEADDIKAAAERMRQRGGRVGGMYPEEPNWREVNVPHDESFFNTAFFQRLGIPVTWGKPTGGTTFEPVDLVGVLGEIAKRGHSENAAAFERMTSSIENQGRFFPRAEGLSASERIMLINDALIPWLKVVNDDDGKIESLAKSDPPGSSVMERNRFNEMKVAQLLQQPGMENVKNALGIFFSFETSVANLGIPAGQVDALRGDYNRLKTATKSQELAERIPTRDRLFRNIQTLIDNDCSLGEVAIAFQYFKLFGMSAMNFQYGKLLQEYGTILGGDGVAPFTGAVGPSGETAIGVIRLENGRGAIVVGTLDENGVSTFSFNPNDRVAQTRFKDNSSNVKITDKVSPYYFDPDSGRIELARDSQLGGNWWPIINNGIKVDDKHLGTFLAYGGVDAFLVAVQGMGDLKLKSYWGDVLAIRKNVGEIGRMVRRDGKKYKNADVTVILGDIDKSLDELRKPAPATLLTEVTANRLKNQRIVNPPGVSPLNQYINPQSETRQAHRQGALVKAINFVLKPFKIEI